MSSTRRRATLLGRLPTLLSILLSASLSLLLLGLTGCQLDGPTPRPVPTATASPERPFTVLSTDRIRGVDPAAVVEQSSMLIPINVFQRLMSADPGQSVLRPDAARDCLFTGETVFTCTLNQELFFHNGNPMTSRDVKFSIDRAMRLAVPGSSAVLLDAIRRVETPDPRTVRFVLSRIDSQIGWALASPAASIVDSRTYDADNLRADDQPIVGSGPFAVSAFSGAAVQLKRFEKYVGRSPAQIDELTYQTVPDSATIEDAMAKQTVDVAWRGLNGASITRYGRQSATNPGKLTDDGYSIQPYTGTRIRMLQLSAPAIRRLDRPARQAIAVALQGDRTLDSIVPGGVTGHVTSFPLGGKAVPEVTWANRINLTLGYDSTIPDGQDQANQIRTRLEDTGGLSVRLRPDAADADLALVDRKAFTATGLAWLLPYLENPPPDNAALITSLQLRYQSLTISQEPERLRVLGALQKQAAVDLVLLPLTQSDEYIFAREGTSVAIGSFGPGWQLGLFGMRSG